MTSDVSLTFGSRAKWFCAILKLSIMSLLGVPVGRLPPIASSALCYDPQPRQHLWLEPEVLPCVSARWSGMSGCLANPTPGTCHEPNIRVDANDEHTPINLPDSNGKKQLADYESVDSRNSIRETVCGSGKEKRFFSTLFRSESKGKRDRDLNVVQSLEDRENLHKILESESWLGRPRRENSSAEIVWSWGRSWGEKLGKEKFWKKLFMRSIRSSNLIDFSNNKQVAGQIRLRETKSAWMENWNWEIGSSQEDHARDCQETEELRRICLRRSRSSKTRIDELSKHQERNPTTVSQFFDSDAGVTEQGKFLVRCKSFCTILNQGAALERPTFPVNPIPFWVPEPCLAAILDCRVNTLNGSGRTGNVFERPPAQEGRSSTIFNNSKNLTPSSSRIQTSYYGNYKEEERERVTWKENRWIRQSL